MKLSDGTIRCLMAKNQIDIDPMPDDVAFQPCSVDLKLSSNFYMPYSAMYESSEPKDIGRIVTGMFVLRPGTFVLGSTEEYVSIGRGFVAQVHGKSTLARLGIQVHAAGLVDPGFQGTLTLEIVNFSPSPIPLFAGKPICQITFERLDWPATRPYGHPELSSHYQGQVRTEPARTAP